MYQGIEFETPGSPHPPLMFKILKGIRLNGTLIRQTAALFVALPGVPTSPRWYHNKIVVLHHPMIR